MGPSGRPAGRAGDPVNPVGTMQQALALTDSELARLFGVDAAEVARWLALPVPTTETVQEWVSASVPAEHQERLLAVIELVDLLTHRLRPELLPAVVRRQAAAYDGRSILDMLAAGRHTELLDSVRASFDYELGHKMAPDGNPARADTPGRAGLGTLLPCREGL